MSIFAGHWTVIENKNLDPFLESLGMSWLQRKAAAAANVTQEIKVEGNVFTVITTNPKGPKTNVMTLDGSVQVVDTHVVVCHSIRADNIFCVNKLLFYCVLRD
jgi:hypothetical protein